MLSLDNINANKNEFIALLRSVKREGAHIEELINLLEGSDFFTAPASSKYHGAYEGGLCDHSLNVYYNLMHLITYKGPQIGYDIDKIKDSIIIIALLHDISKMNFYSIVPRNVKVYSPEGDKKDNLGSFYWDTVTSYATREASDRFVFGSHEMNSEYLIREFIPLSTAESCAILHHMGGMGWDSAKDNITEIYNRFPLATLLHTADILSTYVDERI